MSALSAGNRRVIALTGPEAIKLFQDDFETIKTLSQEFKIKPKEVLETIKKQKEELQKATVEIKNLKKAQIEAQVPAWLSQMDNSGSVPFLYLSLDNYDLPDLKEISIKLLAKQPGFYFLLSNYPDKSLFLATVSKEFKDSVDLKKLGAWLNSEYSLKGGGNDFNIQGGGPKQNKDLLEELKKQL